MASFLNPINCMKTNDLIRQVQEQIERGIIINSNSPQSTSKVLPESSANQELSPIKQIKSPAKREAAEIDSVEDNKKIKINATKYCQYCDIELTSVQHANQHYAGRKHRNVVAKIPKPPGEEIVDKSSALCMRQYLNAKKKVDNDGRFGIGEAFKLAAQVNFTPVPAANYYIDITPLNEPETTNSSKPQSVPKIALKGCNGEKNVLCKVCDIYVSSAALMDAHVKGVKHLRKLKLLSTDPAASNLSADSVDNSIYGSLMIKQEPNLEIDWSMYRTPSGAYYCQACNVNLTHKSTLQSHISGKKHLKREAQQKSKVSELSLDYEKMFL